MAVQLIQEQELILEQMTAKCLTDINQVNSVHRTLSSDVRVDKTNIPSVKGFLNYELRDEAKQ